MLMLLLVARRPDGRRGREKDRHRRRKGNVGRRWRSLSTRTAAKHAGKKRRTAASTATAS